MPFWVSPELSSGIYKQSPYRPDGFYPFVDDPYYYGKVNKPSGSTVDGINTTAIDNFREGINLRSYMELFRSNQPKIFFVDGIHDLDARPNGEITHKSAFFTPGQALDFIQYTGNAAFDDSHLIVETRMKSGFSPMVDYLIINNAIVEGEIDAGVVYPLQMNGGPQYLQEAIIEVFPLPFRLATIESPREQSYGVFGEFCDGGSIDDESRFGSVVVEQFVERSLPLPEDVRYYLELGEEFILVKNGSDSIIGRVDIKPSAIADDSVFRKITPWLDEAKNKYFPRFTNTLNLLSASVNGQQYFTRNYGTTAIELQTRDKKSSAAGNSYYGPNVGYYGTDSIAFGGLLRGS
jgi:hypothetical protein